MNSNTNLRVSSNTTTPRYISFSSDTSQTSSSNTTNTGIKFFHHLKKTDNNDNNSGRIKIARLRYLLKNSNDSKLQKLLYVILMIVQKAKNLAERAKTALTSRNVINHEGIESSTPNNSSANPCSTPPVLNNDTTYHYFRFNGGDECELDYDGNSLLITRKTIDNKYVYCIEYNENYQNNSSQANRDVAIFSPPFTIELTEKELMQVDKYITELLQKTQLESKESQASDARSGVLDLVSAQTQ